MGAPTSISQGKGGAFDPKLVPFEDAIALTGT
ncbi:unnamed protein product [Timema podura]|uniref:PsbH n=1 Tax=Timema podura TaxID=61482 RepID=A0ABN7PNX2_TIMPD|nr:unnamed protein product [Timema podura]